MGTRGFVDMFAACGGQGMSWDPANPLVARGSEAHLPSQHIDHIFLSAALAECVTPASACVTLSEHSVVTPEGNMPCSDHYAVLTELVY